MSERGELLRERIVEPKKENINAATTARHEAGVARATKERDPAFASWAAAERSLEVLAEVSTEREAEGMTAEHFATVLEEE